MNVIVSLLKSIIESKNIWKLIKQRTLKKISDDWGAWPRGPPWIRHWSQFRFRSVHQNELLYIVYNFCHIRSRNPRVHDVNNSTFCSDTAKIGVSCQISQNILDLSWPLYRFVRRISRDDFPSIRLAVVQEMLLWQPVNYGRCLQTSGGVTITLCFGIRQRIRRS